MADDRICVSARVRPRSTQEEELGEATVVSVQDDGTVTLSSPAAAGINLPSAPRANWGSSVDSAALGREATAFSFDAAFDSPPGVGGTELQKVVYEQIGRPVLQNALEGINGCLFAYGQTGSGKTFSLFGSAEAPGVLPRLAEELLEAKTHVEEDGEELSIKAAFLELYNENLIDLLCDSREPLKLFENSQEGVLVPDLSEMEISSETEFSALLDLATQNRSVGATCMNMHSSRSHALIQLRVQWRSEECTKRAKIHLIDLAGSERQKRAKNEGTRMKEGIHINVSLSALGLVISRLSEIAQGRNHCSVPYRDSKLTFLLKDSLSGNARTHVLIALSPASSNYEESLSSLRFAQSVKKIRTRAVADVVKLGADSSEVQALQSEVERLRAEIHTLRTGFVGSTGCCYIGGADGSSSGVGSTHVDSASAGETSGRMSSGRSHDNDPIGNFQASVGVASPTVDPFLKNLEGTYRSPQGTRVEVTRDGCVRFAGTEHHPIRIFVSVGDDKAQGDTLADTRCVLQADGDPEYRYILVSEDECGLVWRHEPLCQDEDGPSGGGLEFRWDKVQSGTGGTVDRALLVNSAVQAQSPADPVSDARVAQALERLRLASSVSGAVARVCRAVPSLARGLAPVAAEETIEALISLCVEVDDANALLDQGADIGIASTASLHTPRLDATWLAPEANQEMSARELLRVKVVWQSSRSPRVAQVWSVFEFARWLDALRGPDVSVAVDETPRRAIPGGRGRSSFSGIPSGYSSPSPGRSPLCVPGRNYSSDLHGVPRSPSPAPLPRPSPSPTPMPQGLESTRSLPEVPVHDLSTHQRPASTSCSSPSPAGLPERHGGRAHGSQQRPQSADPFRDGGRAAVRERPGRRSPTPPSMPGARRRSSSATAAGGSSSRRLGVAAGAGDPCTLARAFDKNSLRLRNGRIFVDALDAWRLANGHRPSAPLRRLQPGMCAVFVRKRPMFERDRRRCDFDVLSVVRNEFDADGPVGPEIAHHACMFDKSMVNPFVCHTQFPFDGVFDGIATNQDVYRDVGQPLLENALRGHLATLFVFGQTGSGKTYTMRSIERMAAEELFDRVGAGTEVGVTYFELAGRKALDLLTDQKAEIRLREEEDGCFRPHDCEEALVTSAEDLLKVMGEAAARRATDATTVNASSSRSHSVCRITILQRGQACGRLLLVDCAGTERSRDTLYFKGQHVKESAEINSSLFALKDCIRFRQAAINRQRGSPQDGLPLKLPSVRATPLTKVLAESLISTSAQLAAIATVSPNATDAEHTIDTLRTVYTLSGRGEARVLEMRQVLE